jgi:hypothetical protein
MTVHADTSSPLRETKDFVGAVALLHWLPQQPLRWPGSGFVPGTDTCWSSELEYR